MGWRLAEAGSTTWTSGITMQTIPADLAASAVPVGRRVRTPATEITIEAR
jgi:hypothetical protein